MERKPNVLHTVTVLFLTALVFVIAFVVLSPRFASWVTTLAVSSVATLLVFCNTWVVIRNREASARWDVIRKEIEEYIDSR